MRVEVWSVREEVCSVRVEVGLHDQPAVSVVKTTLSVCVAERNNTTGVCWLRVSMCLQALSSPPGLTSQSSFR